MTDLNDLAALARLAHERGIAVSTVAAALGASIIERHLTLDRAMDGPDHAASLEPQGFKKMVRDIRQVAQALGTGEEKFFSRGEILNREVLAKSLVATRQLWAIADGPAGRLHVAGLCNRNLTAFAGAADGGWPFTLTAWQGSALCGAITCERDERAKVRHIGQVVGMIQHCQGR